MVFIWFVIKRSEKKKNIFGHFWQLFDNIWYVWPLHIKVGIQNIHFATTRNAGSPLLGPKLNSLIFIFSYSFFQFLGYPDLRNTPHDSWRGLRINNVTWFHMVFIWSYLVFIWFYVVLMWFYMVFIWFSCDLNDFNWFSYDFTWF